MEPISNTASNTVTQRESDRDLLRILEGQNHMLAREQSRLFFSNVILAIREVADIATSMDLYVKVEVSNLVEYKCNAGDIIAGVVEMFSGSKQ